LPLVLSHQHFVDCSDCERVARPEASDPILANSVLVAQNCQGHSFPYNFSATSQYDSGVLGWGIDKFL
jgi:hypothetical protein